MSKLSLTQKTTRVLRFLLGIRHPTIAGTLVAHGFSNDELEEGWSLLRGAVGATLDRVGPPAAAPGKITLLDEYENKWFPIAAATLQRSYPAVYEKLFRNLFQTAGAEVVVSVGTFIGRVEGLGTREDGSVDAEGREARELLERRGLDDVAIAYAKTLLSELTETASAEELPEDLESDEHQAAAEQAMWAWYLEWSTIARAVIKNRNLLRHLGFLQRSSADGEPESTDDTSTTPEIPPPTPTEAPEPSTTDPNDSTDIVIP